MKLFSSVKTLAFITILFANNLFCQSVDDSELLNMLYVKDKTREISGTFNTAIMTGIPVETDILYVLSRKFPAQHYVTTEKWVFIISPDGKITRVPADKFNELKSK